MADVLERLHDAIASLLTTDATFTAALVAAIAAGGIGLQAVPKKVLSNQPLAGIEQLGAEQLPCWVLEPIDGEAGAIAGLSEDPHGVVDIGATLQAFRASIGLALVWHQK